MGQVDEEMAPDLFTMPTSEDTVTKDVKRKTLRVQPTHQTPVNYHRRSIPLHPASMGFPAVMLLPPNHPHAITRMAA
jgi:hypothetical protein